MPSFDMVGHIKNIGEVQTFSGGFSKRDLLVNDDDPRFPQDIVFEFTKDRARKLEDFRVGDNVKVSFDIRCREHNGRYFVSLNGWRIERADNASPAAGMPPAAAVPPPPPAPAAPAADPVGADIDNLPF